MSCVAPLRSAERPRAPCCAACAGSKRPPPSRTAAHPRAPGLALDASGVPAHAGAKNHAGGAAAIATAAAGAAAGIAAARAVAAATGTCAAPNTAVRRTACIQPVAIAEDDGSAPTRLPMMVTAQRIWEKCCIGLTVRAARTVNKSAYKTLDESPTNTPTAEESALFADAGSSSCIQVFVPATFAQGGRTGKDISGGGGTYDGGSANPKIVVVEGTVPEVVAHEVGHALGAGHDTAATVMKPTGSHAVANSSDVSLPVCAGAKTGAASTPAGAADCCMVTP